MNCETCKENNREIKPVPYIVHESMIARMERTIKRLWILVIIAVAMLMATNGLWLWHDSQFQDVTTTTQDVTQTADGGSNNFVGGDIIGDAEG